MGEKQNNLFEPDFNHSIKVQSSDHRLTSTAGVLLLREAESKLGLIDSVADSMRWPGFWGPRVLLFQQGTFDSKRLGER
jgi:hypothetical protein